MSSHTIVPPVVAVVAPVPGVAVPPVRVKVVRCEDGIRYEDGIRVDINVSSSSAVRRME
jgi:hypothetical protein